MNCRVILILAILFLSIYNGFVYPLKKIVLNEVIAPMTISVGNDRLFVSEKTTIHIYSLPEFRFIKSFGAKGVGPGEFRYITDVTPTSTGINVCEYGKICFFDSNCNFLREIRTNGLCSYFAPIGDQFIGSTFLTAGKKRYNTINFFDSNLKTGKEIYRYKSSFQFGNDITILSEYRGYDAFNDYIFINGENGRIHVYNKNGDLLRSIKIDTPRVEVTDSYKKEYLETLKNNRRMRNFYSMFKDKISFPDYFPTIYWFMVTDNKIYVITYLQSNKGNECQVLNLEGKVLRKTYVPLQFEKIRDSYPFAIKNSKFYQIVEDVENENFVLHITDI